MPHEMFCNRFPIALVFVTTSIHAYYTGVLFFVDREINQEEKDQITTNWIITCLSKHKSSFYTPST